MPSLQTPSRRDLFRLAGLAAAAPLLSPTRSEALDIAPPKIQ